MIASRLLNEPTSNGFQQKTINHEVVNPWKMASLNRTVLRNSRHLKNIAQVSNS